MSPTYYSPLSLIPSHFFTAIMLSRIKLSLPDIRRAILELDDNLLSVDDLKAIGKQLPTSEEVR